MSFLDTVRKAKAYLEEQGRVSLRGLKREFALDDDALEDLIEELVEIQEVATRGARSLEWSAATAPPLQPDAAPPAAPEPRSERDPKSYTPRHLADKILRSKAALEGERKQVTVLFADVKGSMELAEQVDAEEWHGILDRFFQILADGVHRFEGTVNQYTGDGIMALFGAPISHEDHAQRACYAALHLRDELRRYADELRGTRGLNFSVRIGINSGEVVVGKIGDDLRMDYTAQGHTVGLAARLEQLAEAGTILLSQATASHVEGYFELEDLGATRLKGVADAVSTYRLSAVGSARTRLDISRARGFSRFVGRADELATLEAAFERASSGQGQVLGIAAEAGAGKSRLCLQFADAARRRGVAVIEARGVAHGRGIPYLPIRELFRSFYDIREDESPDRAREKIAGRLLLLDTGLRDLLPTVFDFLGIADPDDPAPKLDPRARLQQLYSLARRVVEASTGKAPFITLVEDLHWFDEGSLEFLAHMVDATPRGNQLMLLNFRPEFSADWMLRSSYQQLPLQPLGREAIDALMDELLGDDPSLSVLPSMIHERTGGNPFFVEEVILELAESAVLVGERGNYRLEGSFEQLGVPRSVNALLAARIDRLPERDKRVVQLAAVIGHRFDEPTLSEAHGGDEVAESLQALCEAEFVYPQMLYPVAEYSFKHALTAQVAYESQLGETRARAHADVARAIQKLHEGALDEQASVLAHHWEEAGERVEAARAHRRAAIREGAVGAEVADRHWREVRSLLAGDDDSDEILRLRLSACIEIMNLSWRLRIDDQEMSEIHAEGRQLAEALKDERGWIAVETFYGALSITVGKLERAFHHLEPAERSAKKLGDAALLANVRVSYLVALEQRGMLREAKALGTRATATDPGAGVNFWGFDSHLWMRMSLAYVRALLGELSFARRELERLYGDAVTRNDVELRYSSLNYRTMTGWLSGDVEAVRGCIEELLGGSKSLEHTLYRNQETDAIATLDLLEGRFQEVIDAYAGQERRIGNPQAMTMVAMAHLGLGHSERAIEILTHEIAHRLAQSDYVRLFAQIELARALVRQDVRANAARIDHAIREADTLLESTGGASLTPRLAEVKAERASALGEDAEATEQLQLAQRLYEAIEAQGHARRVAEQLGT